MRRKSALFWGLGAAIALYLLSRTKQGETVISTITEKLARVLEHEEGNRLTVYPDTGGVWTVGRGHKVLPEDGLFPYTNKRTITESESLALFERDTASARAAVATGVKIPVSENKKVALSSLAFNIGNTAFLNSTLLKKLNSLDFAGAAAEFDRWIYDNGKIDPILVARRKREKSLFLS